MESTPKNYQDCCAGLENWQVGRTGRRVSGPRAWRFVALPNHLTVGMHDTVGRSNGIDVNQRYKTVAVAYILVGHADRAKGGWGW